MKQSITPTIGRIILFCLTQDQADQINRRRTSGASIAERIKEERWPLGAQAHIGNDAKAGDVYPGIVLRVWSEDCINARVFLDGNDDLWVTSVSASAEPKQGRFHWMPYQVQQAALG